MLFLLSSFVAVIGFRSFPTCRDDEVCDLEEFGGRHLRGLEFCLSEVAGDGEFIRHSAPVDDDGIDCRQDQDELAEVPVC